MRPLVLLAAISALALSMAALARPIAVNATTSQVWLHAAHQGADSTTFQDENDCGDFKTGVIWHFVLNQYSGDDVAHLVAEFDGAGTLETDSSKQLNSVQHFYLNTPTDDVLVNAYAEVQGDAGDANLVLSHVCHTGVEGDHASLNVKKQDEEGHGLEGAVFTVEGMEGTFTTDKNGKFCVTGLPKGSEWLVTEIQAPAGYVLADPASQMVKVDNDGDCNSPSARFVNTLATATPTPTPTPEGSVAGGTSTPTPTTEGSVQGGTGTPEASQPDTAMGAQGAPGPVPTIAFALILLAALGTLAWANVKARSRS
jgi:hypothetical protein